MEKVTGADFKSATADDNKKLFIETYGCQMNVADSEVIASVMQNGGIFGGRHPGGSRCSVYEHLLHPRQCGAEDSEPSGVLPLAQEEETRPDSGCAGLYGRACEGRLKSPTIMWTWWWGRMPTLLCPN